MQVFGPLALALWAYSGIRWRNARSDASSLSVANVWREHGEDSRTADLAEISKRWLGFVFYLLFLMNAILVLENEKKQLEKLYLLAAVIRKYFFQAGQGLWPIFLVVGPVINCWTLLACSCAMFPCLIDADNAKDVVFDALALLFLSRLDDVGGDFAYLETIWDGELLGQIHATIKDQLQKDFKGVVEYEDGDKQAYFDKNEVPKDAVPELTYTDDEGQNECQYDAIECFMNQTRWGCGNCFHYHTFVKNVIRLTQTILFVMAVFMPAIYLGIGDVQSLVDVRKERAYKEIQERWHVNLEA